MVEVVVADAAEEEAAVEDEVEEEDPETITGTTRHKGQLLLEINSSKQQEPELFDNFARRIGLVLNP